MVVHGDPAAFLLAVVPVLVVLVIEAEARAFDDVEDSLVWTLVLFADFDGDDFGFVDVVVDQVPEALLEEEAASELEQTKTEND